MPTRSYILPSDLSHFEKILEAEGELKEYPDNQGFSETDVLPISSPGLISVLLGVSPKIIYSIRIRRRRNYRTFRIPKKKAGTYRNIEAPRTYLKVIQWWVLDNILSRVPVDERAFGFVKDRSAVKNASYHLGAKHLLNVDIKDFFPSISEQLVVRIFEELGYRKDVAEHLAAICTLDERLPQGAPTSPAIANIVCRKMDDALGKLSESKGLKYSRYADDLTFSGSEFIDKAFLHAVRSEVALHGFSLNADKTRFAGPGDQMEITGVVVNSHAQPPRRWRKNARAKIYNISQKDRLIRRDLNYLNGILGMAGAYPESPQVQALATSAEYLIQNRKGEVVGVGDQPKLPFNLTQLQALALTGLRVGATNADLAARFGTSESAIKKRLRLAFRKIGRENRNQARIWAEDNL